MTRPTGAALVERLTAVWDLAWRQYEDASRAARRAGGWDRASRATRDWVLDAVEQYLECNRDLQRARQEAGQ